MTMKKFYISDDREYLELMRKESFEEQNMKMYEDTIPYSEFHKPYHYEDEEYPWWEWTFPDYPFPDLPPTDGDIEPSSPCSMDGDCKWAKIFGTDSINVCGTNYMYSQMHYWEGCSVAPWWAAYGSWALEEKPGGVELISSSPVMATIHVDETASTGIARLCYYGPLGCSDCKNIRITCDECCEDFTLTGASTVDPGSQWTGTIDPACPGAKCWVVSNSGCTITCQVNEAGSQVTATPGASDCGSFKVTVYDDVFGCDQNNAEKWVRINDTGQGGGWTVCYSDAEGACITQCTCEEDWADGRIVFTGGTGVGCLFCSVDPWVELFDCDGNSIGLHCMTEACPCDGCSYCSQQKAQVERWECEC